MNRKIGYIVAIIGIVAFMLGFVNAEIEDAIEDTILPESTVAEEMVPYEYLFRELAPTIHWEWETLAALAYVESHYNPLARSSGGAKGVMQLMDGTAYELGLNDSTIWIAEHNIRAGVRYLQHLQGKWSFIRNIPEQTKFVLASYNAGPGPIFSARRTVRDTGGNPYVWSEVEPYVYQEETRRYVKQVLWLSNKYKNESLRRQNDSIRNSQ